MKRIKQILSKNKNIKNNNKEYSKVHLVFSVVYLVQLVILVILGGKSWIPITTNYLAYDSLLSSGGQVVHTAGTSRLFDLNIAWVLILMLCVSVISHILFATTYKNRYLAELKSGGQITNWVLYGVISSFVILVLALLSGVFDLSSLILIVSVNLFASAFGIISYSQTKGGKELHWFTQLNAIKASLLPWIIILIYIWGTFVYGGNSINAYVYWLYLSVIFMQGCYMYVLNKTNKKQGKFKEIFYSTKILFAILLVMQALVVWQVFLSALK